MQREQIKFSKTTGAQREHKREFYNIFDERDDRLLSPQEIAQMKASAVKAGMTPSEIAKSLKDVKKAQDELRNP